LRESDAIVDAVVDAFEIFGSIAMPSGFVRSMTSAFGIMETLLQQFPQLFGRLEAILHQLV
jgi:hypothetical protein